MKNSLFDMLLSLFENSISTDKKNTSNNNDKSVFSVIKEQSITTKFIKSQNDKSTRIFNFNEKMKFSENCFQLLILLFNSAEISNDLLESVINRLINSKSDYVTFEQVKHAILSTLAQNITAEQLAFLDLLFYQKEDGNILH